MSDATRGRRERDVAPEPGELQLRKVLSTMNDLEPPRDDLFAQRALQRGRARTSRHRSTVFGAAAALVVVGAVGGTWVAATHGPSSNSVSAGSAARSGKDSSSAGSGASAPESLQGSTAPGGRAVGPSMPSARDIRTWFGALSTRQTNAFDAIDSTLASRWPDVYSGAYAATRTGDRVAVAVTRHDPGLESFVAGAMPAPTDVEFVIRSHTFAQKQKVAREIVDQRELWRSKGVEIVGVTQDGRSDQVVVVADGSSTGLLVQQYGDIVRVEPPTPAPLGKVPGGGTLPPLQR
ncbi:MAG TPA: hypothetical protein VLI66_00145 [Terrabacter sp.]|nr:hypothetical protein [Terrabacter sp.]